MIRELLSRGGSGTEAPQTSDYGALELDAELVATLREDLDREAIVVRPDRDNGGIDAMSDVLESLHQVRTEPDAWRGERNISPAHSFELRYATPASGSERRVTMQYIPGTAALSGAVERQLQTRYPDSQIDAAPARFFAAEEGQYVAGAHLELRRYCLYPIKNADLPGFRTDPTGSILQEMVGLQEDGVADADVAVQVMFQPARRDWTEGVANGHGCVPGVDSDWSGTPSLTDLSYNLRQESYERKRKVFTWETIEKPPSKIDKKVAELLEGQQGAKAWRLCLRVLAVSDSRGVAINRAEAVAGQFRNFYESASEQTFVPQPRDGDGLRQLVTDAAAREFVDRGLVKAEREVAGLVNIPEADHVATNKLQWSLATTGDGVPPGTPRYDFDAAGVATASDEERQYAMLTNPAPGDSDDAIWLGRGFKHGTEAGVRTDFLNAHMFVGGRTRYGKTTLLTNVLSQLFDRNHGALVVDPKGKDADEFIAEWPADRDEDDLIVMDLGDEYERTPRFNFLETPDSLEPGTRAHASYIEGLADDITAMVAQAGGSDNYLGALMKRVTKTLVRGLAKSGRDATLLDLACAASTSESLGTFERFMTDERIHFIRETAQRLAEKEDADLEPLAGRMDEWIHNDAIRDLISAREPSFSIQEAVDEGKVIVVRFPESAGETEKQMLTTALIRRTYCAKRMSETDDPFYLVCDEFDKIATQQSNLHTILSEAGAHGYRLMLACQAPASQLPERLKQAVANQIENFVTFDPGEEDARYVARHHSLDPEELTNLPRYQIFLRQQTTTDGAIDDLSESYRVRAFPPVGDVRERLDRGETIDVPEVKQRSVNRYGSLPETPDEQQAASPFFDGEATPDTLDVTEAVERAAVQGVYDTTVRTESESVTVDEATPAVRRRVAALDETPPDTAERLGDGGDCWRRVLQHVRDDWLAVETRDGDTHFRAQNPRSVIATVGENQSAGGAGHAMLLWDSYRMLTTAGLDVSISDASGTDPDALARAAPDAEQPDPDRVDELLGDHDELRVEAECSTGQTKPGATVRHVCQAAEEGRGCLVVCRPDTEDAVRDTLVTGGFGVRSDYDAPGELFYTSPRDLRIGGETITRPGDRENVWTRKDGEIILRDGDGAEWARFDSVEAVFRDADPYPSGGDVTIKRPVIPKAYAGDPDPTIVVVPEGATSPAEITVGGRPPVPDHCEALFELLRDADQWPVSKKRASELVEECEGVGISQATVYRQMGALADAGVITEVGSGENGAVLFAR